MADIKARVTEIYNALHAIPEVGFSEHQTAAYLTAALQKAGYAVTTGVGGTGIIGVLPGGGSGPVIGLRADMDALEHTIDGETKCVHSCGHDAHCAIALTAAELLAAAPPAQSSLKIIFQPAEEKLDGALSMINSGALGPLDILLGIHLRPIQEAKSGQATPALYHGASYIATAAVKGVTAHGARPHLGVNAIDAAAAVVNAVNAIHLNPVEPWSVKTTKLHAGGATLNAIPDLAEMAFDLRAQSNTVMDELLAKLPKVIETAVLPYGAAATVTIRGGVPAAEYDPGLVNVAREAIAAVLGPDGVLDPIVTPGGEDFHYFTKRIPGLRSAYVGLGCDLTPGLHHPGMSFDLDALPKGVEIMVEMVKRLS